MSLTSSAGTEVHVDEHAPVMLHGEIEIAASPDVVWEVLSSIEHWPDWNHDVKSASLEGELQPGTSFRWRAGGSSLRSRLIQVAPTREIGWTGTSMGINVVHVYRLEGHDGKTLVQTDESVAGITTRLFRKPIGRRMDAAIQDALRSLKAEAERRATA